MALRMYEIKYRKRSKGTLYTWHRYATDTRMAREGALIRLENEYGKKVKIVSVKRLTPTQERKVQHG